MSANPKIDFNNAMVELYTNQYRKMGYHSDQSLDLVAGSTICLFSCYNNPATANARTLVVRNKQTGVESQIRMAHNSIISFDTHANQQHTHKIVLDSLAVAESKTEWIGVTFRLSKTHVKQAMLVDGDGGEPRVPLRLASNEETIQFMQLKSEENKRADWGYPDRELDYTLSPGDLMPLSDP